MTGCVGEKGLEELTEVSVGVSSSHWGCKGKKTKQLEHMGDCHQSRNPGLLLLNPSSPDLFIYLPFSHFGEGREPAGLE